MSTKYYVLERKECEGCLSPTMREHLIGTSVANQYKFIMNGEKLKTLDQWKNFIKSHPIIIDEYGCSLCTVCFLKKLNMSNHMILPPQLSDKEDYYTESGLIFKRRAS